MYRMTISTPGWERMSVELAAQVIFLTGLSGAGKSAIGAALARRLPMKTFDTDTMIVRSDDMTVREIFDRQGEQYFRRREREIIFELLAHLRETGQRALVSLGGGALMDSAVTKRVRTSGVLIYLKISCGEAARRLLKSETRPLILNDAGNRLSQTGLTKRLRKLLSERRTGFERAHFTIAVARRSPDSICANIIEYLKHAT